MAKYKMYVDGSFDVRDKSVTKGAMILLDENDNPIVAQRYKTAKPEFAKSRNVGGELISVTHGLLLACMFIQKRLEVNEQYTIDINYDYAGIRNFIQGPDFWVAKKPTALYYVDFMKRIQDTCPRMSFTFNKIKSHTGNKWNELVDVLAGGTIPVEVKNVLLEELIW